MSDLSGLAVSSKRLEDFAKLLGRDIEKRLSELGYRSPEINFDYSFLDDENCCFIYWNYKKRNYSQIKITKNNKREDKFTIERFWAILPCPISGGTFSSTSDDLRNTARVYDEVAKLLGEKFGKPVLERDERTVYRAYFSEHIMD